MTRSGANDHPTSAGVADRSGLPRGQGVGLSALMAQHARQHGPRLPGRSGARNHLQDTRCWRGKAAQVRYYLERRDPEFAAKMAEVLCVYREVKLLKKRTKSADPVAIVSYDEKPACRRSA
jgi:hypothetical protein